MRTTLAWLGLWFAGVSCDVRDVDVFQSQSVAPAADASVSYVPVDAVNPQPVATLPTPPPVVSQRPEPSAGLGDAPDAGGQRLDASPSDASSPEVAEAGAFVFEAAAPESGDVTAVPDGGAVSAAPLDASSVAAPPPDAAARAQSDALDAAPGDAAPTPPALNSDAGGVSPAPVVHTVDVLVDDFEDGDRRGGQGSGWWYVTNDGTAEQYLETEAHDDRGGSLFALHGQGEGFADWGAFVGLDLGGVRGYFDATGTVAVRFWARSQEERSVVVRFIQEDNLSVETQVSLSVEWQEHVVPYDALRFAGDDAARLDPSQLQHLQFFFGLEPFDVWVDDVLLLVP